MTRQFTDPYEHPEILVPSAELSDEQYEVSNGRTKVMGEAVSPEAAAKAYLDIYPYATGEIVVRERFSGEIVWRSGPFHDLPHICEPFTKGE